MLSLTLSVGDSLQIGDDIEIVFKGNTSLDRTKVSIDAPKEKNIKRLPASKGPKSKKIIFVKAGNQVRDFKHEV